ncbi:MAG: hypothetical protein MR316_09225 [Lachnospiraceae bacterium]|nr:hypothetical protein [Lachnospiraceae bacterium]
MVKNVRMRLLLVMQVLTEQTDTTHGMTMKEILEWVASKGIAGERKSVYEDIHALQEFGLPIIYHTEDKTYRFQQ